MCFPLVFVRIGEASKKPKANQLTANRHLQFRDHFKSRPLLSPQKTAKPPKYRFTIKFLAELKFNSLMIKTISFRQRSPQYFHKNMQNSSENKFLS